MTAAEPPPAGDEAPQDPAGVLVLLVLGLQGMGTLFAFNTIITPLKYYELRFAASPFSSSFESMLSITFNAVALASIVAFQRLQHVIRLRTTIFATLACELVVFATLTVYTLSPLRRPADELHALLEASSTASFTVTLCCTALAAAATGLLNGSVVAYCAMFPARYTQVAVGGMALAGLAVSVAGLATTVPTQNQLVAAGGAGSERDAIAAAGAYYGVAVAVFAACLASFAWADATPFARHVQAKHALASCSSQSGPPGGAVGAVGGA
ncbi:hypothetical protein EMIHUDRAFT_438250, partial [Emiliania huxleyi CCMP1516]|uniref:Uncharacterized protein n=3 Tax=Emiliania huxleyi TaxID=2903 RepID=A0A0D3IB96_EMIH1